MRVPGKFMSVDHADGNLVVGVGGKPIAVPEMRADRGRKSADKAMYLFLCRAVAGCRVVARQSRQILSKAMARGKAVVPGLVQVAQWSPAIPAAHVFARRRKPRAFAIGFEEAVFVERGIECVVPVELFAQRSIQQGNIAVAKLRQRRRACGFVVGGCETFARLDQRSGGNGRAGLQKCSARLSHHGASSGSSRV